MSNAASAEDLEHRRAIAVRCLEFAAELLAQSHAAEARALADLAARWDVEAVRGAALHGPAAIRPLAAAIFARHRPRGAEIARPCAILGSAGATLAPEKIPLIRAIFDRAQEGFEAGTAPTPRHAGLYGPVAAHAEEEHGRPPRILQVLVRHANANPACIESDVTFHFSRSAARAGLETRTFDADALLYDVPKRFPFTDAQIAEARRALEDELAAFRPDVLLFDGNAVPTGRTLDPAWLHAMRQAHGCRIVTVIPDCYDMAANVYGVWAPVSDAVVIFNAETTHAYLSGHFDKAFLACGLPFDEPLFAPSPDGKTDDKTEAMTLVGSNSRGRDDLVTVLTAHGVPITARLHDRLAGDAPDMHGYAALLRAARMTCNTGRVPGSHTLSLVTGRCFEAILAKTVLLEEVGSRLDDYFVPFVHYVPFANTHQLVMFAQFLEAHDAYRRRIADQAYAWHRTHYASRRFWRALLERLGLTPPAPPAPAPG